MSSCSKQAIVFCRFPISLDAARNKNKSISQEIFEPNNLRFESRSIPTCREHPEIPTKPTSTGYTKPTSRRRHGHWETSWACLSQMAVPAVPRVILCRCFPDSRPVIRSSSTRERETYDGAAGSLTDIQVPHPSSRSDRAGHTLQHAPAIRNIIHLKHDPIPRSTAISPHRRAVRRLILSGREPGPRVPLLVTSARQPRGDRGDREAASFREEVQRHIALRSRRFKASAWAQDKRRVRRGVRER